MDLLLDWERDFTFAVLLGFFRRARGMTDLGFFLGFRTFFSIGPAVLRTILEMRFLAFFASNGASSSEDNGTS